MKYKLRLNEDPEFETEVNHYEETNNQIIITDVGTFDFPHKAITIEKIELIGDDGKVYAMRKFPSHLVISFTPEMIMTIQFKLNVDQVLIGK
jgi:hypothetical protein